MTSEQYILQITTYQDKYKNLLIFGTEEYCLKSNNVILFNRYAR